ncbi:MAG: tRNA-dihydrouridine synthase [Proteobacteria bacterium]|nr:tRNA-dihydrouridine synthase [Pseudomonadota bacterium]
MSEAPLAAANPAGSRLPALQIGRLRIWPPILQAPMAALTHLATRTIAERFGCGMAVTEFVPAAGLAAGAARVRARMRRSQGGGPLAVQIYGREPGQMRRAAAIAAAAGAELVDINMGCPAKTVTRGQCGAALMREPALAVELVHAVGEGVAGRAEVTVKLRAGWDDAQRNAPELAALLVAAGAAAVTVHGRTRAQRFSGPVDYALMAAVKAAVRVPVIANGDIVDVPTLEHALRVSRADGAMIGRAAIGDPWLFARLKAWCEGRALPPPPTPGERIATFLEHCRLHLAGCDDESRAVQQMRTFAGRYLAPLDPELRLRPLVNRLDGLQAIEALLDQHCRVAG